MKELGLDFPHKTCRNFELLIKHQKIDKDTKLTSANFPLPQANDPASHGEFEQSLKIATGISKF